MRNGIRLKNNSPFSVFFVLNERGRGTKCSKILILGLAYKKDVDDVGESPSLELIELLRDKGAKVDYNVPYVPMTRKMRHYDLKTASVSLTEKKLKKYDCVVISTDHSFYDYNFIAKNRRHIVDTRNATKGVSGFAKWKIIKA